MFNQVKKYVYRYYVVELGIWHKGKKVEEEATNNFEVKLSRDPSERRGWTVRVKQTTLKKSLAVTYRCALGVFFLFFRSRDMLRGEKEKKWK